MGNTYSRYINPSRNRINPIGEYGLGREILERIEQCGNRVVVTGHNLIHDFRLDGTLRNGARDVGPACDNFNSAILFKDEVMTFRLFNLFDTVSRRLEGEDMIFTFIDGEETRAKRMCKYPED